MFELMRDGTLPPALFAILLYSIACIAINFVMARSKNYNQTTAVLLGLVPIVNVVSSLIYLGLPKK